MVGKKTAVEMSVVGKVYRNELLIGRPKFPRERDRVRRQARLDPPQRKKKLKRMLHFAYAS